MKYTLFSLLAIFAASLASAKSYPPEHLGVKRQDVQSAVPIYEAAMSDANGNVLAFDSANVYVPQ